MGVAFPGMEGLARDLTPVVDAGVGDVRLQQQIGRGLSTQGRDLDPQHQGVAIRIGEEALFDLEPTRPVARRDLIGGRQGAALGVHMQIFGPLGGVGPLDRQAVRRDHRETQGLDLGLVDQAVHGLGQDAVGDGEPDLRHRAGRSAVAVLAVDIGFIGGPSPGLGGAGPGRQITRRARSDSGLGRGGRGERQAGGAGEAEGTEVTHCGPHGLRVGAGERRKLRGTSSRWFHEASLCWAPGKTRLWKSPGP